MGHTSELNRHIQEREMAEVGLNLYRRAADISSRSAGASRRTSKTRIDTVIRSAVADEISDLHKIGTQNKRAMHTNASLLKGLTSVVKNLRSYIRTGSESSLPTSNEPAMHNLEKLAERLPDSLNGQIQKVYGLHKSLGAANTNNFTRRIPNTHLDNDENKSSIWSAREEQLLLPQLPLHKLPSRRSKMIRTPVTAAYRKSSNPPPVFNRLLDDKNYTGIYNQRFLDFQSSRNPRRSSFSRMMRNRNKALQLEMTSRTKWKRQLRASK